MTRSGTECHRRLADPRETAVGEAEDLDFVDSEISRSDEVAGSIEDDAVRMGRFLAVLVREEEPVDAEANTVADGLPGTPVMPLAEPQPIPDPPPPPGLLADIAAVLARTANHPDAAGSERQPRTVRDDGNGTGPRHRLNA
jgi:hypothetical protein